MPAIPLLMTLALALSLTFAHAQQGEVDETGGWGDQPVAPPEQLAPAADETGTLSTDPAAPTDAVLMTPEEEALLGQIEAEALEVLSTPPGELSKADSRVRLRDILRQQDFQGDKQSLAAGPSLIERFFNWLSSFFQISGRPNNLWVQVLTVVLVLLIVFIIARLLWEIAARRRQRSAGTNPAVLDVNAGSEALLLAAQAALGRKDFRAAIRYRYLASLARIDVQAAALLTNSQILRQLRRRHPGIGGSFGQLVQQVEYVWYGGGSCGIEDYGRVDSLAVEIEQAATPEVRD